jgi:Fanconi-associated nuclease 1
MIFALLFWDIIFMDIPGTFETPYQIAPLDLTEDSFYYARKELIETRLEEIRRGSANTILERHDDKYREKKTLCVGVRWDICEKQDLLEIVEVSNCTTCNLLDMTLLNEVSWWRIPFYHLSIIL